MSERAVTSTTIRELIPETHSKPECTADIRKLNHAYRQLHSLIESIDKPIVKASGRFLLYALRKFVGILHRKI